jgi:hypothetical protein
VFRSFLFYSFSCCEFAQEVTGCQRAGETRGGLLLLVLRADARGTGATRAFAVAPTVRPPLPLLLQLPDAAGSLVTRGCPGVVRPHTGPIGDRRLCVVPPPWLRFSTCSPMGDPVGTASPVLDGMDDKPCREGRILLADH